MKNQLLKFLLITFLFASHVSVKAEDIDLFVGTPPNAADVPNVLIILDNTANWTSAFTNEMAALASVVNGLPADKFRVGLMMFSETGIGNSGNDGAYVRAAIRTMNSANKTKYQNLVSSLNVITDKSNGGKIGKSMEEAYLYFSAGVPMQAIIKIKRITLVMRLAYQLQMLFMLWQTMLYYQKRGQLTLTQL